jgi:glyoxylase-like metal-dependent hydrolase (beta-lactamase superfamily II)
MTKIDRRVAMAGLAAGALTPLASKAWSQSARYAIGEASIRVISDGHMMVGLDRYAAKPTDEAAFKAAAGTAPPRFAVNVTLVELAGKRILIDAGAGGTWVDTAGKLGDALGAAGIDPASIDHVVITHGHPDHLWGVIDDFDNSLRFPKATYIMPKGEYEFWTVRGTAESAGAAEGVTAGARRVLKAIDGRLKTVGEGAFLPGLAFVQAPGHTPGQCVVLVSSGQTHALIAADTLFHPVVSVRYPDWAPAQDMDPAMASWSRRRVMDLAAQTKALVVAYHIDGAGRIARDATAYRWEPA